MDIKFDSVESAIEDIRNGKMIIVTDDENRSGLRRRKNHS